MILRIVIISSNLARQEGMGGDSLTRAFWAESFPSLKGCNGKMFVCLSCNIKYPDPVLAREDFISTNDCINRSIILNYSPSLHQ